jgi:hypothetical protein
MKRRGKTPAIDSRVCELGFPVDSLLSDKEVTILGGRSSQLSALAVAIEEQQPDEWSSAMGA